MNKEYVLITGATGFIGSHVATALLENGSFKIIAPVRKTVGYKNTGFLSKRGVVLKEGPFFKRDFLGSIFNEYNIDYVIHIAALRGEGKGNFDNYQLINVKATEILLDCAFRFRVKRFVYCSSVGVWGAIPKTVFPDEATPYVGDNLYHQSKIEAEKAVNRYMLKGLDTIIVRPTIAYGEGDDGFPVTLIKLVKTRTFIMPRKETKIHLVSVKKIAELFVLLIKKNQLNHNIFLALDKEPISLKQIADTIYSHFYGKPYPKYLQVPGFLFSLAIFMSRIIQNDLWTTRFKLISNNWYYREINFERELHFKPADTELEFKAYLKSL